MSVAVLALLVGATVSFASATQRITGLGYALVASPPLVLLLGAATGVALIQIMGVSVAVVVLLSTFKHVSWRKAAGLALPALVGIIPGWWLARTVPGPVLLTLIGGMVLLALLTMVANERARIFRGAPGLIGAGFLSGFMNVIAGVGGPAVVLYKLSTNWRQDEFVATTQAHFVAISTGALLALGWPSLPLPVWGGAVAGLVGGLLVGQVLSKRVPVRVANRLVVAVALIGSLVTLAQGVTQLL